MLNKVGPGNVEQSVHLLITAVIYEFDQQVALPDTQIEFDGAVNDLISAIFEQFKPRFARIKNAEKFKNIFLNEVRSRQDTLLQDASFGNTFMQVKDINDDLDIDQSYFEAIIIYCTSYGIGDRQPVIKYFIKLHAFLKVFHTIRDFKLATPEAAKLHHASPGLPKLSSMSKPYRFFSFDLNLYQFINDPDATAEENTSNRWLNQKIILETKFASAFKKNERRYTACLSK